MGQKTALCHMLTFNLSNRKRVLTHGLEERRCFPVNDMVPAAEGTVPHADVQFIEQEARFNPQLNFSLNQAARSAPSGQNVGNIRRDNAFIAPLGAKQKQSYRFGEDAFLRKAISFHGADLKVGRNINNFAPDGARRHRGTFSLTTFCPDGAEDSTLPHADVQFIEQEARFNPQLNSSLNQPARSAPSGQNVGNIRRDNAFIAPLGAKQKQSYRFGEDAFLRKAISFHSADLKVGRKINSFAPDGARRHRGTFSLTTFCPDGAEDSTLPHADVHFIEKEKRCNPRARRKAVLSC